MGADDSRKEAMEAEAAPISSREFKLLFFFFFLKRRSCYVVLLSVWPGTQNIDLAGLKFAAILLLLLLSAGMIGTYIITSGLFQGFLTAGPSYLCVSFYHTCGGGPTKAFILF